MLSGKVQGQFLSMISQMIRPMRILEIGTFTGYSAYCLSKGLPENGKIITIEVNDELEEMIRTFFTKSGIDRKVELMIGDALEILPGLKEEFDLVFIDANKESIEGMIHRPPVPNTSFLAQCPPSRSRPIE